jgi:hypothetical protein
LKVVFFDEPHGGQRLVDDDLGSYDGAVMPGEEEQVVRMIAQVAAQAEALAVAGSLTTRERDEIYTDAFHAKELKTTRRRPGTLAAGHGRDRTAGRQRRTHCVAATRLPP